MAIPVKLWRRSSHKNSSLTITPIHLDATEFRISIERSISAFALPFNNAYKVGMDLNLPITVLNITGVLVDDEAMGEVSTDAVATISTLGYYPRENGGESAVLNNIKRRHIPVYCYGGFPVGATSVKVTGPVAAHFRTGLSQVFSVGDKLYVAGDMPGVNGKLVSDTTITVTNSTTNTLTLGGSGLVHTLNNNVRLSNISPDLFLHHQGFALVPGLWLDSNGDRPSQINPNTPIVYRFDGNTVSQYATGGSGVPTFVAGTEPESGGFPTINIPIGGLYTDTVLGNPAKALLLSIKDGIDCSANVSVHPTSASGGRNSASAFDTVISSDGYTLSIIRVDEGSGGRGMFHYSGFSPSGSGTGGTNSMFYQSTSSTIGQDYTRVRSVPLHSNFTGGNPVRGGLSAGDKAQDLLGIFANSPIDTETELLGIQVPYDSLIQSSTTSPEVRNFFLTYGNVSESAKISDGNVFLGSQEMEHKGIEVDDSDSILETIGDFLVEDEDNIFSKTYDLIDGVFSAAMDLVKDVTITLMAEDGGNKGGIQIIPARLNIRYDAGERHYTYDMLLSAVNFKIAP